LNWLASVEDGWQLFRWLVTMAGRRVDGVTGWLQVYWSRGVAKCFIPALLANHYWPGQDKYRYLADSGQGTESD
jgi:hypothetical protein